MGPDQGRRVVMWLATFLATFLAALVALAAPAAADPPEPTDYRSTITDIAPSDEGLSLSVVGGDAFLRLRAEPGHEITVYGYDDEPYLRFRPDGTVQENLNSEATYTNSHRYADVDPPDRVDPEAAPDWEDVADGGTYAWHDHRIHWMSPQRPSGVGEDGEIQTWDVKLAVDGQPVTVHGRLVLVPSVTSWPWLVVIPSVAAAAWLLARRRGAIVAPAAAVVACVAAVAVAGAEYLSIPPEADRQLAPLALPLLGLGCGVVGVVLRRRKAGLVGTLAAAAAALGWAGQRLAVFTKPELPTDLDPALDRAGTALALALALAAAAVSVVRPTVPRPPTEAPVPEPTPAEPAAPEPAAGA